MPWCICEVRGHIWVFSLPLAYGFWRLGGKKNQNPYHFMVLTVSKACSWFASALGPSMCLINFGSLFIRKTRPRAISNSQSHGQKRTKCSPAAGHILREQQHFFNTVKGSPEMFPFFPGSQILHTPANLSLLFSSFYFCLLSGVWWRRLEVRRGS